jgi:hypothetical protein
MGADATGAASGGVRRALLDRLLGPGATRAEAALALGAGLALALAVPALAHARGLGWSAAQSVVAGLLAFDLFGGVAVNASDAGRRFYHAPGRRTRDHLAFVAAHVLHVVVLAWLFRDGDWGYAALFSALLLASAALILAAPAEVRRPAALLIYAAIVFTAVTVTVPTPGMEWFIPVLFLKLLVAYLLGTVERGAPRA